MIKVGIIGDTHLSEQTPRSWKADYSVVTLNDLVTAVKMTDVSIILGDFFHRPVISEQYKLEVSRRLGELTTPVYTIWGNHDVEGLNLASADRTSLNLLHEFGVVKGTR
jgi:DNA repair exonuclease SbcCD nuclease subunit